MQVLARLLCVVLAMLCAQPAAAAEGRRLLDAREAEAWRGVGRLNIAGRRFCTATLVAPDVVLTAAHCLFHPRTKRAVRLSEVRFVAGLRLGGFSAVRRVQAVAISPDYVYDSAATLRTLSFDVALLALDAPVEDRAAAPFAIGDFDAGSATMTLVSYARDRAHAPSIERACDVTQALWPVAALDCDVTQGASGAPVFDQAPDDPAPRVVAVVTAEARGDGGKVALTVAVSHLVAPLMAALGRPRPAAQTLRP